MYTKVYKDFYILWRTGDTSIPSFIVVKYQVRISKQIDEIGKEIAILTRIKRIFTFYSPVVMHIVRYNLRALNRCVMWGNGMTDITTL